MLNLPTFEQFKIVQKLAIEKIYDHFNYPNLGLKLRVIQEGGMKMGPIFATHLCMAKSSILKSDPQEMDSFDFTEFN